jgi:hypothetical protein
MTNQQTPDQIIEEYIKERFPNLKDEDYFDLQAEAILFLSQELDEITSSKEMSQGLLYSLAGHLFGYWQEKQKDRSTKYMLGKSTVISNSRLRTEFNEGLSDEEILSARSQHIKDLSGDNTDQETILALFDLHREELRKDLPLIEFEALEILTTEGAERQPRLTLGMESMGLQMLFRRARIRILWRDQGLFILSDTNSSKC